MSGTTAAADRDVDSVSHSGCREVGRRAAVSVSSIIHRDYIRATPVDIGDYSEFDSVAVKLVGCRSASVVLVCVFRPPGAVTATFIN